MTTGKPVKKETGRLLVPSSFIGGDGVLFPCEILGVRPRERGRSGVSEVEKDVSRWPEWTNRRYQSSNLDKKC